jgi:hypothetical protein
MGSLFILGVSFCVYCILSLTAVMVFERAIIFHILSCMLSVGSDRAHVCNTAGIFALKPGGNYLKSDSGQRKCCCANLLLWCFAGTTECPAECDPHFPSRQMHRDVEGVVWRDTSLSPSHLHLLCIGGQ